MAPALAWQASSMNRPRASTSFSPSSNGNVPAAACAVHSPSDRPAAAVTGKSPTSARRAASVAKAVDKERGLAVGGEGQLVQRSLEGEGGKRTPEHGVGLLEKCRRGGEMSSEFAAHADGLRTLPGKEESDFFCHPGLKKHLSFCQR